jgi:CubicO group peptidase (beta-lactamase class C family)
LVLRRNPARNLGDGTAREASVSWSKLAKIALVPALAASVALPAIYHPGRALLIGTGAAADALCAKTFVSGLDPRASFEEILTRPGIHLLRRVLRYHLDRTARTVDVSIAGLFATHAAFHDGLGCVRVQGGREPYLLRTDIQALRTAKTPPLLPEIAGPEIVEPSDPALKAALDHAFEEPPEPPFRRTKAVVVVRDGRVIAERYATGVGIDTPLPSFSMTKSLVNALLGIMTQQGLTSPSLPAPIPEWHGTGDPRREIEVGHLMRMTSGLALDETDWPINPSDEMFLHNDMAAFAVNAPLIAPPGTRWAYSSATTQILTRIIREAVGGPEQTLTFAWRELFDPLGMRSVTLFFDGSGTLQGANNMLASARDWARFGLLYLHEGKIADKRILHEEWVDYTTWTTLNTDYAAGFWTNHSEHPRAKARVRAGIPSDAYFASGNLGQRCVIIPSQNMVVVRMGDAVDPTGDIRGLERLIKDVIEATNR